MEYFSVTPDLPLSVPSHGDYLDLPPPSADPLRLDLDVANFRLTRRVGGALARKAVETGGKRRGYRVRADGQKIAIPLSSYDRQPAAEVLKERERARRALGKSVGVRISELQRKTTVEDDVPGRRLSQYKLLGRSALADFED